MTAAAAAVAAIVAVPGAPGAATPTEQYVSLAMVLTIAQTALAECGPKVSVAVVDRTGRLRAFLQGDEAAPDSIELARRMAFTAATFGRTSLEWAERDETQAPGQRAFWSAIRLFYSLVSEGIPLQGGLPIKVNHNTIMLGGVGVSGASWRASGRGLQQGRHHSWITGSD